MRRLAVLLCTLALACAACSDGGSPTPPSAVTTVTSPSSAPSTSPTPSPSPQPSPSPSSSPSPQPDVALPAGMAAVVDDAADMAAISAGDLTPLVPAGSNVGRSAVLATPEDPVDQVAVTWVSGEPPARRSGVIVWQRVGGAPAWTAVYAFTDPKRRGVFGVEMDQGDVTGDGIPDLLTFEDVGGSGACGDYRVIATADADATEIFRRSVCDTEIRIAGRGLRVREAVFEPEDPHCCPSAFRTTVLRWNGTDWVEASSEVSAAPSAG